MSGKNCQTSFLEERSVVILYIYIVPNDKIIFLNEMKQCTQNWKFPRTYYDKILVLFEAKNWSLKVVLLMSAFIKLLEIFLL